MQTRPVVSFYMPKGRIGSGIKFGMDEKSTTTAMSAPRQVITYGNTT